MIHSVFRLAEEWPEFPMFIREASRLGPAAFEQLTGDLEALQHRAVRFLQEGMDAGEIRKQDPTFLLFQLYTAVVGSLTEASVLRAMIGEDKSRSRSAAASARSSPSSERAPAVDGRGLSPPPLGWLDDRCEPHLHGRGRRTPAGRAVRPSCEATTRPTVAAGPVGPGTEEDVMSNADESLGERHREFELADRGDRPRLGRARGGSAKPIRADAGGSTRPCPTTSSRTRSARAGRCSRCSDA